MAKHGDGIETCLICGSAVYSRGLCSKHHTQYHRRKKSMNAAQAEEYEAELISAELLAPPKPTGRAPKDDPFAAIAERITGVPVSQVSKKKALPQIPGVAVTSAAELAEAEADAADREARDRETTQSANRPARTPRKQRKKAAKPPAKKVDTDDKRKQA